MAKPVIGIASSILTKSEGFEGLGFVVTSNTARSQSSSVLTPAPGLHISTRLIKNMEGVLSVESGGGRTTFCVMLPLVEPNDAKDD